MTFEPKTIRVLITAGVFAAGSAAALATAPAATAQGQQAMSFFITSAGSGDGANLGGLAGADKICQTLAAAAGGGGKTWHAYLSAAAANGQPAVNAKDRIGKGPWKNAKGDVVAKDVADLHSAGNNMTKQTALSEKGDFAFEHFPVFPPEHFMRVELDLVEKRKALAKGLEQLAQ